MMGVYPRRGTSACIAMLFLILDGKTALMGAREGLALILNTVIPSLFPFFFLSILLSGADGAGNSRILCFLGRLFRVPDSHAHLLVPAFLGGYPAGAQAVSVSWKTNLLSREEAQQLLGFCSNAGPSFLFGIVSSFFPHIWMCWLLWGIHISGAFLAAQLLPRTQIPETNSRKHPSRPLPEVLSASLTVLANVCGWLLLFRIILTFLDKWLFWLFPGTIRIFLSGLLELTNGCSMLGQVPDFRIRFILCSLLLSAGGLCVLLQTKSVTEGLSLKWYYQGKGIQTIFSGLVSASVMYKTVYPLLPLLLICLVFLKSKKTSSFPLPAGV